MRFLVVFVLAVMLALANAQTTSDTNSNTNTNSVSTTNTNSNSNSNTNSNSNSNSNTGSWTKSVTNSWTPTVSATQSQSGTGTATITYPQPPAPISLANECLNHITIVCLTWSDPLNFVFNYYRIYYQSTVAGSAVQVLTSTNFELNVGGLLPATTYNFWVAGVDTGVGVWSANSTVFTYTTAAADPKYDNTRDIQSFACAQSVNPTTSRVAITCTWTAAQDTVIHVNLKCHCVASTTAPFREPLLIRKKLWGTKAQATSVLFAVNRDNADCNIYARFYYQRRPTTRHHAFVAL